MNEKYQLVFDVGNTRVGVALFQQDLIVETAHFETTQISGSEIDNFLEGKKIEVAIIGSVHYETGLFIMQFLKKKEIKVIEIDINNLSIILDVEAPIEVGADRIANTYGALCSHPNTDLIVIDIGTAVVFDVIARERRFLGGAIASGPQLCAKALASFTDMLPFIELKKPKSCVSKSTSGNIQSGVYYGLIGTIEKIVKETKSLFFGSGNVVVVATGGLVGATNAEPDSSNFAALRDEIETDLKGIVDFFEPDLTFLGLYEILKERI